MADETVVIPFDDEAPELPRPPEFANAPPWAYALFEQQRRDRHHAGRQMSFMQADLRRLGRQLGKEPNSDGLSGEGLIGDLRKTQKEVSQLLDLKKMGIGAVAGVMLFGAIIVAGLIHLGQQFFGAAK